MPSRFTSSASDSLQRSSAERCHRGDAHHLAVATRAHGTQARRRRGHDRRDLLIPVGAVRRKVAAARVGRCVSADEIRDDGEPAPRAKHLFGEGLHRGAVAWIGNANKDPRVLRSTGQVTKRVTEGGALRLFADGNRHVRALLQIRAEHRRTNVAGRARKYYGALRKIEHRG